MTKRLASKHKVDRRLKSKPLGKTQKAHSTQEVIQPGQHGQIKSSSKISETMECSITMLSKN